MSEDAIEARLAAQSKAPRITPDDIAANISSEHYFTAADGIRGANDLECERPAWFRSHAGLYCEP